MGVSFEVSVIDVGAAVEFQKIAQAEAKMDAATAKATAGYDKLNLSAKKLYQETRTPAERHNQRMEQLNRLLKAGKIDQDLYARSVQKTTSELQRAQAAGQSAFGAQAISMVRMFAGMAGVGSIASSIYTVMNAYQQAVEKSKEVAAEARKAGGEIVAFAALQEGGTKAARVQRAAQLAAQYGISDRGEAFDTVQAMQSIRGGDFEQGLSSARTVFQATKLGISLSDAKEMEILASGQGKAPGYYLRMAYAAGEASGRTPQAMVGAAEGLKYWGDSEVGFAAAVGLAGSISEQKMGVYLKRGGEALSEVGGLQPYFKKQKMGGASQLERIAYLHKMGVDTPEELTKIGLTEKREREAVLDLVKFYPQMEGLIERLRREATTDLFERKDTQVGQEIPTIAAQRRIEQQQVEFKDIQAMGPLAFDAMIEESKRRSRGLVYYRHGLQSLVDENGQAGAGFLGTKLLWADIYRDVAGVDFPEETRGRWDPRIADRPLTGGEYLGMDVNRQMYEDLQSIRARLGDADTPEGRRAAEKLDAEIEKIANAMKYWSEAGEVLNGAAERLNEAAERLSPRGATPPPNAAQLQETMRP